MNRFSLALRVYSLSRSVMFPSALAGALLGLVLSGTPQTAAPSPRPETLQALATLQPGFDPALLAPLEARLRAAARDAGQRTELERELVRLLESDATWQGKEVACRLLKPVATATAVPALADLLGDPQLAARARDVLETLPDAAADRALLEALDRVPGPLRVGVITSLGVRRTQDAVPALLPLARSTDPAEAAAAWLALGRIGTPEAARVLAELRAEVPEARREALLAATFEAGERLLETGQLAGARAVFEPLYREVPAGPVRQAAFQGLVRADPAGANGHCIRALASADGGLRDLAARLVAELPADWDTEPLVRNLPHIPARAKVRLMEALALRRDPHLRSVLNGLMRSSEPDVAVTAVRVLGAVGSARDVSLLAGAAITTNAAVQAAARAALREVAGREFEDRIVELLPRAKPDARVEMIRALGDRGAAHAAPALVWYVGATNPVLRSAALDALSRLGGAGEVGPLLARVRAAPDNDVRAAIGETLAEICGRAGESAGAAVLEAFAGASTAERLALLPALSRWGAEAALAAVERALTDPDAAVREAAFRALTDWNSLRVGPMLARLAREAESPAWRTLAFRAWVQRVREVEAPADARLAQLREALAQAGSVEDKRLVLAALAEVPTLEALQMVAQALGDPALAEEAGAAAVRICPLLPEADRAAGRAVLELVLAHAKAAGVLNDARRQLRGLGR